MRRGNNATWRRPREFDRNTNPNSKSLSPQATTTFSTALFSMADWNPSNWILAQQVTAASVTITLPNHLSRLLMGCTDSPPLLLRGVGASQQCPLGSVVSYQMYAEVRIF